AIQNAFSPPRRTHPEPRVDSEKRKRPVWMDQGMRRDGDKRGRDQGYGLYDWALVGGEKGIWSLAGEKKKGDGWKIRS
ncbi:hypothetical protein FRC11_010082, partial [Ceratobasidium sp. 423]